MRLVLLAALLAIACAHAHPCADMKPGDACAVLIPVHATADYSKPAK